MAGITNYIELQTAVAEYLARENDTGLIARIPTFVQLAEAKFNRELFTRQMETRSTLVIDINSAEPQYISLPSDFQSMRRLLKSGTGITGKPHIEFKSNAGLDDYRVLIDDVSAAPEYFTIVGDEIELAPTPDIAYTVEMVYRRVIPPLETNVTNWLLTAAPDLYLYGALLESAPYMKEDGRIQVWGLGFKTALDGLNELSRKSATFSAGPMRMRVAGVNP